MWLETGSQCSEGECEFARLPKVGETHIATNLVFPYSRLRQDRSFKKRNQKTDF